MSFTFTGDHLRALREERNMTRKEFADWLGDSSESTINKWERGINPVPSWVIDKLLGTAEITLPLLDLQQLLDLARHRDVSFTSLISASLRRYLAQERSPASKVVPASFTQPSMMVAETPPPSPIRYDESLQEVKIRPNPDQAAKANQVLKAQRPKTD